MSEYQRYAVYCLPDNAELATFGAAWLGWDVVNGCAVEQPNVDGIEAFTATPHKYGFHGTLKPPFRLAVGTTQADLQTAVAGFAAHSAPVATGGLRLAAIGSFLALVPREDTTNLARLAFACVSEFDGFRRPAEEEEIARRRAAGLNMAQDAALLKWGYPYVGEEFRFHLTLTSKLDNVAQRDAAIKALSERLPHLPDRFEVVSLGFVGERTDGRFELIKHYRLGG